MKEEVLQTEDNKKYLIIIGVGVFICLLILTIISLLDLQRDYTKDTLISTQNNQAINTPLIAIRCPNCGNTGVPKCFYCGSAMQWKPSIGQFCCPFCRRVGQALCPTCNTPMQPVNQTVAPQGTLGARTPVSTGYMICTKCNYRAPMQPGVDPRTVRCPRCGKMMQEEFK